MSHRDIYKIYKLAYVLSKTLKISELSLAKVLLHSLENKLNK